MKTRGERRSAFRWPVTLLAKCLISKGRKIYESDMWVKDVNEDGLKLESATDLAFPLKKGNNGEPIRLKRGNAVTVQELFYDEQGSHGRQGRIRWARPIPGVEGWTVGIKFTDRPTRGGNPFGTFRDFLSVVKSEQAEPPDRAE